MEEIKEIGISARMGMLIGISKAQAEVHEARKIVNYIDPSDGLKYLRDADVLGVFSHQLTNSVLILTLFHGEETMTIGFPFDHLRDDVDVIKSQLLRMVLAC